MTLSVCVCVSKTSLVDAHIKMTKKDYIARLLMKQSIKETEHIFQESFLTSPSVKFDFDT